MDNTKLVELLRATLSPTQREEAESNLREFQKLIGFPPCLLQTVMSAGIEMPVRQAGAIYLKNLVVASYQGESGKAPPTNFPLHEQDRAMLRESIVDAVVQAPELIKTQLAIIVYSMVQHEFPQKWPQVVEKISMYLQSTETAMWSGALRCLHKLVKNYEYKKATERGPLNEAMVLFLPILYKHSVFLLQDQSDKAYELQKLILKIFYSLVQYIFPRELISNEVFSHWMEIFRTIIITPVPESANQVDEDDRPNLIWWKCKKWAHHIVCRIFERYGSPGNVSPEYQDFAPFYLKTFTTGILDAILKTLYRYTQKEYVSHRVLHQCLNYLNNSVAHGLSWKYLKPNIEGILQKVVFPLMSYSEQDEELWKNDPHEYIRMKFDTFEDFVSPVSAAQKLVHYVCKMRKTMLNKVMHMVMVVLETPGCSPRDKDGALHIVGTVANILLKKKLYKNNMESMLVKYVYPEFQSPHGFLRARACWVLHYFSEIQFQTEANLIQAVILTQNCFLHDGDLPVKLEAAIALQSLVTSQERAEALLEPHIQPVALELLNIIRETENEDLTGVMQKIICTYSEQLLPIAVQMVTHLTQTFQQVMEGNEDNVEDKAITAMGILNTINTILCIVEDQKDIKTQLEPIVLNVILSIFNDCIIEFYEEALALMDSLTTCSITPALWQAFEVLYQSFQVDAQDFFVDMMPTLHNYVTVDTPTFVSNENHLVAVYNMCKTVLSSQLGEDAECHAAKLLEVVVLQCHNHIDHCIPTFVELVLGRLTRAVLTSELRTMCLQVVVAALYVNPTLLLETLERMKLPNSSESFTNHFIHQWLNDSDCFMGIHDRKVSLLGLCTLIGLSSGRPPVLANYSQQIIPAMLTLFEGLKLAYAYRAQDEEDDEESEEEAGEEYDHAQSDDEDVEDEDEPGYMERLAEKIKTNSPFPVTLHDDEDVDNDEEEGLEETELESFITPLDKDDSPVDEYIVFKQILQSIQASDPNWYNALTASLTPEQQKALQEVILLSDQRKAAAESKQIEKRGGYVFQNQTVPTSFNFGGTPF